MNIMPFPSYQLCGHTFAGWNVTAKLAHIPFSFCTILQIKDFFFLPQILATSEYVFFPYQIKNFHHFTYRKHVMAFFGISELLASLFLCFGLLLSKPRVLWTQTLLTPDSGSDNWEGYNMTKGREHIQHGYAGQMDDSLPEWDGAGRLEISWCYSE